MRKLFFIVFLFICSQIVAQSPIPTYIVGDTTILAAYTGTNTLAAVKDTGVTGGMYIYDATGTYVPDGSTNFVTSIKGGIWLHITSLNSGSSVGQRFGIEDNLGIQNRYINYQGFSHLFDNINTFDVETPITNDAVSAKVNGWIYTNAFSSSLGENVIDTVFNSTTHSTIVSGYGIRDGVATALVDLQSLNIDNSLNSTVEVRPSAIYFSMLDNTINQLNIRTPKVADINGDYITPLSVSVNGGSPNYADSTGDIDITSEQIPWRSLIGVSLGGSAALTATTTGYFQFIGRGTGVLADPSTGLFVVSTACTIENLTVSTSNPQPGDGSYIVSLYVNGATSSLTLTIPAGSSAGTYQDTTHQVSLNAGDLIIYQVINNASTNGNLINSIGITMFGSQ